MKSIKLVLSGSGTAYPAHVGALKALVELGFNIESICAVSGGSIIASFFAFGYDIKQIEQIVIDTLPYENNLIDYSFWPVSGYGLVKGDKIHSLLKKSIPNLFCESKIDLNILATNVEKKCIENFSTKSTPYVMIADVIRASISIPFLFKYSKINSNFYIDGGVVNNFPIDFYEEDHNVVGIRICYDSLPGEKSKILSFKNYIINIFDSIFIESARERIEDAKNAEVVNVYTNQSFIDFSMTKEKCIKLINNSYKNVLSHYKKLEIKNG